MRGTADEPEGGARHGRWRRRLEKLRSASFLTVVAIVAVALVFGSWFFGGKTWLKRQETIASDSATRISSDLEKLAAPHASASGKEEAAGATPESLAKDAVDAMGIDEMIGQLVMVPLSAGEDATAVKELVETDKVGSVLLLGNWTDGIAGVRQVTTALQSYAAGSKQMPLFIAADQEGGQVQRLKGAGFSTIPSAVEQGRMTVAQLQSDAQTWGGQLNTSGVNVDLAPSVDTVVIDRSSNAPIGALDRDFGLDADGNARHAVAFIDGMSAAGIASAVKHYPGLGAVTGNTDFSEEGTVDDVTSVDSIQMEAFTKAIKEGDPPMVMMSLATYTNLDPGSPACFSHYIITDILRGQTGFDGVVVSDSLSAATVSGFPATQLGTRFVSAGGDLICVGDRSLVEPILEGMVGLAKTDATFRSQVKAAAERVLTLKYRMNLNQKN